MKAKLFLILICITIFSCEDDTVQEPSRPFEVSSGVYISNEGQFQAGNASITYWNPANGSRYDDIYYSVNKKALGDVCQSMNIINDKLYIVVNNSGKIVVCDPHTMIKEKEITGLGSCRYIVQADVNKAYVSNLYSNEISIIDLNSNTLSGHIPLYGWTEKMLLKNTDMYVTNFHSDFLSIINTNIDAVYDSIQISKGANSIVEDVNHKLWVLCTGDYQGNFNGALYRINPASGQVEANFNFDPLMYPSRLCMNSTGDSLYYINTGIYKMGINDTSLPTTEFANIGNSAYGMAVNPVTNEVYVSDAVDFIQRGNIRRFSADGTFISTTPAGIVPGEFIFFH